MVRREHICSCVYVLPRFTKTLNGMRDCLQKTKGLSLTEPELTATGLLGCKEICFAGEKGSVNKIVNGSWGNQADSC